MAPLVDVLTSLENSVTTYKAIRNEYLSQLRDVLDIYLFSVMEEEDIVYSLLHQRSKHLFSYSFKTMKTLSPWSLQLKVIMTLPFQPNQVKVERGRAGFVMLKVPSDSDREMTASKVWLNACNRRVQKSLSRHISAWKDGDDYLKQNAFLEWFECIVDRSLASTGRIPNYNIRRLHTPGKISLSVEDLSNEYNFTVEVLPVIAFSSSQFPENVVQDYPSCLEWMAECRTNLPYSERLWGTDLWQQEREVLKQNHNLKPMIHFVKSLRDGCRWHKLKNYHIRTLVLLTYRKSPAIFDTLPWLDLLLILLLELRNGLVSQTGLPSYWDSNYNVLYELTGLQRSKLACSVTRIRDRLQSFDDGCKLLFRMETYSSKKNMPYICLSTESTTLCEVNSQPLLAPTPSDRISSKLKQVCELPPRAVLRAEESSANKPEGNLSTRQDNVRHWLNIAIAGVLGIAATGGVVWLRHKKQRN